MKQDTQKLEKCLKDNAFDFLQRAVTQFETDPKYSVINFCTAIELILKAKLVHENWRLIVKKKNPNFQEFEQGKLPTLGMNDLLKELEDKLFGAKDEFSEIAKHRNKIIHFFHPDMQGENSVNSKYIAKEQCRGWYYLKILLQEWREVFIDHKAYIRSVENNMRKSNVVLDNIYEHLQEKILESEDAGAIFKVCRGCGNKASEEIECNYNIYKYECWVCDLEESFFVRVNCPDCEGVEDELVRLDEESADNIICKKCGYKVDKKKLRDQLDTESLANSDPRYVRNCAVCGGKDTVVLHCEKCVCTNCFYATEEIGKCEGCGDWQIGGDLEGSYLNGCEFCDGAGYD